MKKNIFAFIKILSLFVSVSLLFSSCKYNIGEGFARLMKVEERATNLRILDQEPVLNAITDSEEYDVLVITDVHFGNENHGKNGPRREDDFFAHLEDASSGAALIDSVKFVICMGDIAEHGYDDEFKRFNAVIKAWFDAKGIPIYHVVGNHDLYNSGWKNWAANNYPNTSFYKFETPSFSWYFLDSASGTLGWYQYDALDGHMRRDDKKKLVFTHIPVYAEDNLYFVMQNTEERNLLISTCAKTGVQLFVDGHTHKDRTSDFGKFIERNVPGFLEKSGYGVVHINEANDTCSIKVVYF